MKRPKNYQTCFWNLVVSMGFLMGATACKQQNSSLFTNETTSSNGGNTSGTNGGGSDQGSGGDDGLGGVDGGTITNQNQEQGSDGGVIANFKPALVIRATGCIMCHARVESTIITDFGYRDPYFFGMSTPSLSPFAGNIYGNYSNNWATALVWGKVIVPTAHVEQASAVGSLANYLRGILPSPEFGVAPPEVIEKSLVYIGAPTPARILAIAGQFPAQHPQWKFIPQSGSAEVTGLETITNGLHVRNDPTQELVCSGDLFVDGVLFLNNLKLRTTNQGCRIYVTKSVFIQGPIEYLGDAADRNLQITSGRAIIMGLGPSAAGGIGNTLKQRFQEMWTRASYFTRDASGSTQEKLDAVVMDSEVIPELFDAAVQEPHLRAVSFERLLLNAPTFQSRYQGEFKGVIIAETALASLGTFAFKFDNVFERAPVLPRIPLREMLRVE